MVFWTNAIVKRNQAPVLKKVALRKAPRYTIQSASLFTVFLFGNIPFDVGTSKMPLRSRCREERCVQLLSPLCLDLIGHSKRPPLLCTLRVSSEISSALLESAYSVVEYHVIL